MSGQQIGGVIGGIIGAYFGNWQAGYAIGSLIGGYVDPTKIKGPSIGDAQKQTSQAGVPRPVVYGHPAPFAGNIIDGDPKARKVIKKVTQGKGSPTITKEEHFLMTSAIRVCEGPIAGILRIWRNGKVVYDRRHLHDIPGWNGEKSAAVLKYYNEIQGVTAKWISKNRVYLGDESQLPDAALEAIHGVGNTPYYRGTAYVVIENDDVTDLGGACGQYQFEVLACGTEEARNDGDIFVANLGGPGPSYYIIDSATQTVTITGTDGNSFAFPVISLDKKQIYFTQTTGKIARVTIDGGAVEFLEVDAGAFVLDPQQFFIFSCDPYIPRLEKALATTGAIVDTQTLAGIGGQPCINRAGTRLYIPHFTNDGYAEYDTVSETLTNVIVTDYGGGRSCALNIDESLLYVVGIHSSVGTLSVFDIGTGSLDHSFPLPAFGLEIAFSPDGTRFAICDLQSNPGHIWIYSTETEDLLATIESGAWCNKLTYNATGTRLYCTNSVSDDLSVIDTATNEVINSIATPQTPFGVAVWPPPFVRDHWLPVPDAPGFYFDPDTGLLIGTVANNPTLSDCRDVTLRSVEEDICRRCEIPDEHVDLSALIDIIPGFLVAAQNTGAECLQPLCSGFFHDLPEADGKIRAVYRGADPVADISNDDCIDGGSADDDKDTRAQAKEYPLKVSVSTQEPEADYSPIPQTSLRFAPDIRVSSEISIQLPIPFDADIAKQIAHKVHKVLFANAEGTIEISLPDQWSWMIVSDPIMKDGKRWMIFEANTADGIMNIKAIYDRASAYESTLLGSHPGSQTPPGSGLIGPTILEFLNLPMLLDADDALGVYVAVTGVFGGWHGAIVEASADNGTLWTEIADIASASVIGTLLSPLPLSSSNVIDRVNTVRVRVYGELENITEDQLLNELNACVIGDELCQFQNAVLIDAGPTSNIYDIDTLTRGRLDSEAIAHPPGERFVLLNNPTFCSLTASWVDKTLTLRATGNGNTVPDDSETDVWTPAQIQTEWAPFFFSGSRDGSDNVSLSWIGRARAGSNAAPVHSVNFLGYRVSITKGATTIVKPVLAGQSFYYSAAEQTTDFGSATGTLDIIIEAMNRYTGPSAALTGSVP